MRHITVRFDDGDYLDTEINGTNEEIARHYIGTQFEAGCDTKHHVAVVVEFNDTWQVEGVWARSIESGWRGMVIAVEGEGRDIMFKMVGVCELSVMICGVPLQDAISSDDVQWFAPADLSFIRRQYTKKVETCVK